MSAIPDSAREVLEEGRLCYLAASTAGGIHLTPVVFVLDGGRLWATTARRSVKARTWATEPRTAGLVVHEGRALSFRGRVTTYDALDPQTWPVSILRTPAVLKASLMFTLKNVVFFAGYARDAYRVPLAWTPPGRVFFSVDLEAGAVLDLDAARVTERWGRWGSRASSRAAFRARTRRPMLDAKLPEEVRDLLRKEGAGTLAVEGTSGPVVLPGRLARAPEEGSFYAVLPRSFLELADAPDRTRASVVADHASRWRAARMAGVLIEGSGDVFVPAEVRSGRAALLSRAKKAGRSPEDLAVVRIAPEAAVWWQGWTSGTVGRRSSP